MDREVSDRYFLHFLHLQGKVMDLSIKHDVKFVSTDHCFAFVLWFSY